MITYSKYDTNTLMERQAKACERHACWLLLQINFSADEVRAGSFHVEFVAQPAEVAAT